MRSTFAAAAVIATANALVARDTVICCFSLSAIGGSSGLVGQIDDGQTRLGSGLQPAQFCIDSSGAIKDGNGRGCFLTPPTSQLQCDTGATPQPSFSIDSSGKFHHNDTTDFVACVSGQSDQLNIYTNPPPADVSGCRPIELHADRCLGGPVAPPPGGPSVPQGPPGAPPGAPPVSPPNTPPQPGALSSAPGPGRVGPIAPPPKVPPPPEGSTSCPITTIPQIPPAVPAPGGPGAPTPPGPPPGGHGGPITPGAPNTPAESTGPRTPSAPGGVPTAPGIPPFANSSAPTPTRICVTGPCPTGRILPTGTSGPGGFAPGAGGPSGGGCGTNLVNGSFEFPHLIIPIDSSSPNKAAGTSFNGTITSTVSSIFNFDFLPSSANKQCSLVFLFPTQDKLETSSFSFSGDGAIRFLELQAPASSSTSFSNAPQVKVDFGVTNVSPGHVFTIATFACPAGQTVAFELKNAGSTSLDFFEDFNPAPIGLFVTTC
ncbi:hypothetical protein TMatcc_008687 [Talaromyces marneffei ATCC 18224]|uniref:GPI anchored cell wall protein, putative n=2 Tax=Talaromyces marneffei TaxID=37727 RepID=B6QLB2_TALMQ|nr:uncharacterized protein EYB26_008013 [Talaromyces marneffei]EEA21889.1 GPI anchored cell wall protein, putative [Talaromyces marneffei ATCC 18224]KAE8550641.1 hypothetical protein EYB25_006869 [Talaromyces marneffei]QGA20311.1 hypothetical protein EYB26_008013 [Talaromyces marneffei]